MITQEKFDHEIESAAKSYYGSNFVMSWIGDWSWKAYSKQRWQENILKNNAREILEDMGVQITDPLFSQWKRRMKVATQFALSFTLSYSLKYPILYLSRTKGTERFFVENMSPELSQRIIDHGLPSVLEDLNRILATRKEYFEYAWYLFCKTYVVAMTATFLQMTIQYPNMVLMPMEVIASQMKDLLSIHPHQVTSIERNTERSKVFEQWKEDFRLSEGRDPDPLRDRDEWKRNEEYAFGTNSKNQKAPYK